MKKLLFSVACAAMLCTSALADDEVSVKLNNVEIESDAPARIVESRVMLPLRAVFEAVGMEVEWDADNKQVNAEGYDLTVAMQVNNNTAFVNGKMLSVDVAPVIIEDRVFVPVRFISEAAGFKVDWDADEKTVNIKSLTNAIKTQDNDPKYEAKTIKAEKETTTEETTEAVTSIKAQTSQSSNVKVIKTNDKIARETTTEETTEYVDQSVLSSDLRKQIEEDIKGIMSNYRPGNNTLNENRIASLRAAWGGLVSTDADRDYLEMAEGILSKLSKLYSKIDNFSKKNKTDTIAQLSEEFAKDIKESAEVFLGKENMNKAKSAYSEFVAKYSEINQRIEANK